MPSSVQSFSSIFGPVLPASQSGPAGLAAEQPAQSSATKPQSPQANDPGPKVNGPLPLSFRNALKHAGKNGKPEPSGSKDSSKPEKAQAKPGAGPKSQKTGSATQQKNGRKSANTGGPGAPARPVRPAAGRQAGGDTAAESDTTDGPGSSGSHAGANPSPTDQNAQPNPATAQVTPVTPPTRPLPAARAQASKTDTATTSQDAEAGPKSGSADSRATVRATKPSPGSAGDSGPDAVPEDDPSDGDADQPAQDPSLAANTDPGSAVAMATAAGTSTQAARSGAPVLADPFGASGADNGLASAGTVSASAASGMDVLGDLASTAADPPDDAAKTGTARPAANAPDSPFLQALDAAGTKTSSSSRASAPTATEPTPDARFAQVNHPKIVTGVRGELLPGGGTMQLRLDPPELGDLQISVHMRDGVMTAAFQTSNDQATRLLSHSLGNLKSMLEAQGVSVDKLHVQQAPKSNAGDAKDSRDGAGRQPTPEQRQSSQREQQRKEMVQKMWDKLAGKAPVDVMA